MHAQDGPVVLTFLVETQRKIEATGYIKADNKGLFFKELTGQKIYFEKDAPGIARLYSDKAIVKIIAYLIKDADGNDRADSYVIMKFG